MKVYRQGAIKLINSLSRSSERRASGRPSIRTSRSSASIIDDLGWDRRRLEYDTRGLSLQHAARHPVRQRAGKARPAQSFPMCGPTGWRSPRRARRFTSACSSCRRSFQALAREQQRRRQGRHRQVPRQARRLSAFGRQPQQPPDRAPRRRPRATSGPATISPASVRRQSLFEFPLGPGGKFGFEHRRRRDDLQPAERIPGLLPEQRRTAPRSTKGPDYDRPGSRAART